MATHPWDVRPGAVVAALLPAGRVSTDMITGGVEPLFGDSWPPRPLWVCAVRLDDGRRVAFGREGAPDAAVGDAVAASCAIPAFFEPVEIGGQRYVDGGVHSPTNLDLLAGERLDLVIVSSPMSRAGRGSPAASADGALRTWSRAQLDREVLGLRRRRTPVVAFQPTPDVITVMGPNAMDPTRRAAVSVAARRRHHRPPGQRRHPPPPGRRPSLTPPPVSAFRREQAPDRHLLPESGGRPSRLSGANGRPSDTFCRKAAGRWVS